MIDDTALFGEDEPGEEVDDDFLYHLYQGGELLRSNKPDQAREHLERAFALKPRNPRGQNLLGLVYFKLGLYDQAIVVYNKLCDGYPADATLRVNLAMVYLKADRLDAAEAELRRALDLSPDQKSAHRYLGLVLLRQGKQAEAERHLAKAGVRNIDRLIEAQASEVEPRREAVQQPQDQALYAVDEQGLRELETQEIPFQPEGQSESPSAGPSDSPPASLSDSPPASLSDSPAASPSDSPPAGLSDSPPASPDEPDRRGGRTDKAVEGGQAKDVGTEEKQDVAPLFGQEGFTLLVRCPGRMYSRLAHAIWIEGEFEFKDVKKRFGGLETNHPFDRGARAMVLVSGEGWMRFAPPEGIEYSIFQHNGTSGYFLEEYVLAFNYTPAWENGRLAAERGADLAIFHLFSKTEILLACPGRIVRRYLSGEQPLRLKADRLIGWIGGLQPSLFHGGAPLPDGLWIELKGVGEVLVLDPVQ